MAKKQRPFHGPFGSAEFAGVRSHQDARVSSENLRAAAQASILINGGAATAVVAFLTKEHINHYFLTLVPLALFTYALGVACGALMVFCAGRSLKFWGLSWREYMVSPGAAPQVNGYDACARRWDLGAQVSFGASIMCFLCASAFLALILYRAPIGT